MSGLSKGATEAIPSDGVVLSGGPGTGADFLARHLHPGDRVSFVLAVAPAGETARAVQIAALPRTGRDLPSRAGAGISRSAWLWAQVPQAVGGGPHLLVDGQVAVDCDRQRAFEAGFSDGLNPRTAVGTTRDGHHLLLVTVDGRQAFSKGVSLTDMALILKRYGAWNAINLDGGGSTAMAVGGVTVNNPSGAGAERPVADMLLVYSDRAFQPGAPALPTVTADAEAAQEDAPAHIGRPLDPDERGPRRAAEGTGRWSSGVRYVARHHLAGSGDGRGGVRQPKGVSHHDGPRHREPFRPCTAGIF